MRNLNFYCFLLLRGMMSFAALWGARVPAAPQVIRIDGSLYDSSGNPLNGVTNTVQVSAYSAATGGSALWTSNSASVVPANGGKFTLNLDTTANGGLLAALTGLGSTAGLWFEITHNSIVVNPRVKSRGTMFALSSASADGIAGNAVSTLAPVTAQVLSWNAGTSLWEPVNYTAGTVTSASLTVPSIFSLTGSPRTTTGTFALSWANVTARHVFSGRATVGAAQTPTFRALVALDMPAMVDMAQGGTGASLTAANGKVVYSNGSTLALSAAGTSGLALRSGADLAPSFGVLGIAGGGTGQTTRQQALNAIASSTQAAGDIMRFDGSNWVPINRGSTGQVLVATASDVQWQNEPTIDVPSGVIVAWSGTVASIPAGWTICNGTSGTPDLRDRFVVGATGAYAVGASGGSESHAHAASGTFTGSSSSHSHTASSTFSGTAVPHTHTIGMTFSGGSCSVGSTNGVNYYSMTLPGSYSGYSFQYLRDHGHTCSSVTGSITSSINSGSYTPTGTVSTTVNSTSLTPTGSVSPTVVSGSHLPPFYALAFIMKL